MTLMPEASESAKRIVAELTDDEIQQFVKSQETQKEALTDSQWMLKVAEQNGEKG